MESNLGVAQVLFRNSSTSAYGPIVGMTANELTVALFNPPPDNASCAPKAPARVVVGCDNALYTGFARVAECEGSILRLRLDSALQRLRRRRNNRKDCVLPATMRALRNGGCQGAWQLATVVNISFGGARISLGNVAAKPHRVELQFRLPDIVGPTVQVNSSSAKGSHWQHPDQSTDPIRPIARVVYAREDCGQLILGLSFTVVTPRDAAKLMAYTCDTPGEIDEDA